VFSYRLGALLLFGRGPASGTAVGSHERAGAGTARETAGTVPAQTLDGSAAPRGAIWADRPGAQLARNPATGDDKSLGAATARRAHGNGNPCAIEIATACCVVPALRVQPRGVSREPDSDFSSLPTLPPALPDCASAALATAAETKSETSVIPIVR